MIDEATRTVLKMDLDNLTQEQKDWLHDLRNRITILYLRDAVKAKRANEIR